MPAKVTDQPKVGFTGQVWHRPVVVNARDGLHAPAVAVAQAIAVDRLGLADVGAAVAADWNMVFLGQAGGHAGGPKKLARLGVERLAGELMDVLQFAQASPYVLKAGMLLSICPHVFIGDERVGVRLVDNVLVTHDGAEILSIEEVSPAA